MYHYLIGVGAILLVSTAWVGVQRAWRKSFPHDGGDPDALAGRSGCHGCDNTEGCQTRPDSGVCDTREEMP